MVNTKLSAMRILLTLSALFLFACEGFFDSSPPVAKVGDNVLNVEQLNRNVAPHHQDSLQLKMDFVNQWIEQEVLYREAIEQGLHQDPQVEWLIQDAQRKVLTYALVDRISAGVKEPDEGQIEAFYAANSHEYVLEESLYKFALVNYSSGKAAWDNFKLAPKIAWEQEVEWQPLSALDTCLWEPLRKAKLGSVSMPQKCKENYFMLRLDSLRAAGERKTYEESRADMLARVRQVERQAAIDSTLHSLKIKHPVFTWPENFMPRKKDD